MKIKAGPVTKSSPIKLNAGPVTEPGPIRLNAGPVTGQATCQAKLRASKGDQNRDRLSEINVLRFVKDYSIIKNRKTKQIPKRRSFPLQWKV